MSGADAGRLARLSRQERAQLFEQIRRRKEAARGPAADRIPRRAPDAGPPPASFAQERLWFFDRLEPGSAAYNVPVALRIAGWVESAVLAAVLGEVVRRHEVLRTTFEERDGQPIQVIAAPAPRGSARLPLVDLAALPAGRGGAAARRLAQEESERPFDLRRGPLLRAVLLRARRDAREPAEPSVGIAPRTLQRDAVEHFLLLTLHHIVADGWSMGVLVREITALYPAALAGTPAALPALPIQYADFAQWQRRRLQGETLDALLGYWRQRLAGLQPLELPADRARPPVRSLEGAARTLIMAAPAARAAHELARRGDATLFMVLLAAWQSVLGRSAGPAGSAAQDDVAIGTPIAHRNRAEIEPLIGFFVNTLVLRGDLAGDPPFSALVRRARQAAMEAYAHQDLPFEHLLGGLRRDAALAGQPLFQVMLALQNAPLEAMELPGLRLAPVELTITTSRFDLEVTYSETAAGLAVEVAYATSLFDAATALRLPRHVEALLRGAVEHPARRLSELPLLLPSERQQTLREWNDAPPRRAPPAACVHEIFAAQARATPDAPALVAPEESLSYAELAARCAALARLLRQRGVGPETPVGLCFDRSAHMVVAILAVLTAGGAFVPLDPELPAERLEYFIADSGVRLLLTRRAVLATLPAAAVERRPAAWLCIDDAAPAGPGGRGDSNDPNDSGYQAGTRPDNLAYVLYTSGSTGRPKGTMVSHRAIVHLLWAMRDVVYDHCAAEPDAQGAGRPLRVGLTSSWIFDGAVEEMLHLLFGDTVVVLPEEVRSSGEAMVELLRGQRLDILDATPAQLKEWLGAGLLAVPGVAPRHILVGGEALDPITWAALAAAPRTVTWNLYGPTECTVNVTACRVEGERVMLGRPLPRLRAYVLDRRLEPRPAGFVGELCVAGAGVTRGYLGRPDLTAERFVPDPWSGRPGGRLYRTGDLARTLADGRLELRGRTDRQIKLRGLRIEPGEIEAALAALDGVLGAAVEVEEGATGRRLVAWVAGDVNPAELRRGARAKLPQGLVPASFVILPRLPLTPQGKVDRQALPRTPPAPRPAGPGGEPAETPETADGDGPAAPRTPLERLLVETVAEVLGVERALLHDNFFELGGHSLLATRLVSRLRQRHGLQLTLRMVFDAADLGEMAERLAAAGQPEEGRPAAAIPPPPLTRRPADLDPIPASFAQERLWFMDRLAPGTAAYNMAVALRIVGQAGRQRSTLAAALAAVLGEVVRRHEALRTTLRDAGGRPVQVIAPPPAPGAYRLPVVDLAALAPPRRAAEERRVAQQEAALPFDLERGPLLRARLLRGGGQDHVLVLNLHHVVSDGWSIGVLVAEIGALWQAASPAMGAAGAATVEESSGSATAGGSRGGTTGAAGATGTAGATGSAGGRLPALAVQYADFAVWQRAWLQGEALESQLSYWRGQLAGAPAALALPVDRPRPPAPSYRGAHLAARFGRPLAARLRQLALAGNATLYMVLLAGLQALLGRLAGRQDVVVGSPIANRQRAEIEPLIGFFVNNLVLRGNLAGDPSFGEWLRRCRQTTLDAYAHQDLPFERLVEALRPPRHLALTPLFQVVCAMQNAPLGSVELAGLRLQPFELTATTARYDLEVHAWEEEGAVALLLPYSTDLFDETTVRRLVTHLEVLLEAAAADPGRPLSALPLVPPGDSRQVLQARGDGLAAPPPAAAARLTRTAPRTAAEAVLAALWQELLGVGEVVVEDHFFALGGHSLLATQLVYRLREAHALVLPLRWIFELPVLEDLAAALAATAAIGARRD